MTMIPTYVTAVPKGTEKVGLYDNASRINVDIYRRGHIWQLT